MNKRGLGIWAPIALGILVEIAVGIEGNLASNKVPGLFSHTGVILAGLAVVLVLTFLLRLRERRRGGPALVDHIRRRLIYQAEDSLREMSSVVLDEAGIGKLDLRVNVALPERTSSKRFPRLAARSTEMTMSQLPRYVDHSLNGRALIVGEPGGGKSTLMRTIARKSVERSQGSTAQVPVWLDMEEWPDGTSLEKWVLGTLAAREVTGENAQLMLQNNDLYLFLDGLDQIPTRKGQLRAFRATEDFLRRYEMCHLAMTARSDAYDALGTSAEQLPIVRISPLTTAEVDIQLQRAGPQAQGLRQAAAQDDDLAKALNTPLFLKAGLRAFSGCKPQAIIDLRQTKHWDDTILAEVVRLVLTERRTETIEPASVLRYLRYVAKVFVAAQVTSFYGVVPPQRLLDEANWHPQVTGWRTVAAVLAGALSAGVAAWLLIGPRTGLVAAVLGGAGIAVLASETKKRLDLEVTERNDEMSWSRPALRAAAPGLAARLAVALAVVGLVQLTASYEIERIARSGQMAAGTATSARFYVAAFLLILLVRYVVGAAAKVGRVAKPADPVALDLPTDNRKTPRAWWLRLPDLSVGFWVAGLFVLVALPWAFGYQLLMSLGSAHLRSGTVESAFHSLLRFMDFSARSPLQLQVGPAWVIVVTVIGFGLGLAVTWSTDLFSTDLGRAFTAAYERDAGRSEKEMTDLLDYAVQLSLLRQVEGRYSFYHPRLFEFFSGKGVRPVIRGMKR
jgi:hypothetical protein